jgi:capsular exopolysaccharide synthesis family protein
VEPKPLRNVAIALVLGLMLGIGLAFLREYLDDGLETSDDLERATGALPVLGQIPRVSGWRDRQATHLVSRDEPGAPASEAYRTLRTSIQFLGLGRELRTIQVTSAAAHEGKSTTLANLAVAFARAGTTVTVVCCDLRRSRIHEFFGLTNEVGFTSLMLGEASVGASLQEVPGAENLTLVSAGPLPPNPSELLSSRRAREVIASLARISDLVLIDSPPVLPVSDALIVSGMVDATLLVADAKSSSRRSVQRALQMLHQVDAPLVGTVLNNATGMDAHVTYGYGYQSESTSGSNGHQPSVPEIREGPPRADVRTGMVTSSVPS